MRPKPGGKEGGAGGHDQAGMLRWLLTYADMITLLMAFFIMLYSMSVLNLAKFRQVAFSIRSGFGGVVPGQGQSPLGTSGQFSIKPTALVGDTAGVPWRMISQLKEFMKARKLSDRLRIYADERGLVISLLSDKVLFEVGKADIREEAKPVLDKIAGIIASVPNQATVEGHTCDLPIHTAQFPSNWELSTARATNVERYFIESKHIAPGRLSAAGYANHRGVVPNDSPKHRMMNRRVDIVIARPMKEMQ